MDRLRAATIASRLWFYRLLWRLKFQFFREKMPKNADGRVYLNLGSGANTSEEFINIDTLPFRKTHLVLDIQNLSIFPDDSVDMIYASHVLEHIPRANLQKTLSEWRRALKPGGILRFGVPDFDKLVEIYNVSGKETESIVNQLLGQDKDYDRHCTIWNFKYAERILKQAGFSGKPKLWNVKTAEHHKFNDKSNRDNSLNLEVAK